MVQLRTLLRTTAVWQGRPNSQSLRPLGAQVWQPHHVHRAEATGQAPVAPLNALPSFSLGPLQDRCLVVHKPRCADCHDLAIARAACSRTKARVRTALGPSARTDTVRLQARDGQQVVQIIREPCTAVAFTRRSNLVRSCSALLTCRWRVQLCAGVMKAGGAGVCWKHMLDAGCLQQPSGRPGLLT